MANYEEAEVKLTNSRLNKLKSKPKNNNATTLRITKKNFQDVELWIISNKNTKNYTYIFL